MGIRRLPEQESAPLPRGVRAVHELDDDGGLHISVSDNLTADEAHDEVRRIQRLVARERRHGLIVVPAALSVAGARAVRAHPTSAVGVAAGSAAVTVVSAVFIPMAFNSPDPGSPHRRDVRPPAVTAPSSTGGDPAPGKVAPVRRKHPRGKGTPGRPTAVPVSATSKSPAISVETPVVVTPGGVNRPKFRRVVHWPGRVPLPSKPPKPPPVEGVSPVSPPVTLPAAALRLGVGVGPVGLDAEVSSRPGSAGLLPTVAARGRLSFAR